MKNENWESLLPYFQKLKTYGHLISILYYDGQTSCPKNAISEEGEIIEKVFEQMAEAQQDPKAIKALEIAKDDPSLTIRQRKVAKTYYQSVELISKMGVKKYSEWSAIKNKGNQMWRVYRPLDDFKSYLPYWEKVIKGYQEVLELQRKNQDQTLYDIALDQYEPGNTTASIESVFGPLKVYLIKKVKDVLAKQASLKSLPIAPYGIDEQRKLSLVLLKEIGYDMDKGCLRESAHPFSDFTQRNDSRLTTKFLVNDWRSNAFTCLHEGGHCLEFQNWPDEMFEDYADGICSAAICETHSRFYENIIGRSVNFAPIMQRLCSEALDPSFQNIDTKDFNYMVNKVEPGLIRCEADELSYSLHIIIRYEIERDLVNGKIVCSDVPAIWKQKYHDYLGVEVPNDKDGCLQDVHWSDAEIGYFPSYALGNIYGAQILNTMSKDLNLEKLIKEERFDLIKKWFSEHDYCYDWMDPKDWIKQVTGESMNPEYFIAYLEGKF